MSARRKKDQPPMKYRGFYCDEKLWGDMQLTATETDESDSEFIRQSVKERVERIKSSVLDSTHKNNTVSKPTNKTCGNCKHLLDRHGDLVCMVNNRTAGYDKECIYWKPKEQQVQSFPKGGGKK